MLHRIEVRSKKNTVNPKADHAQREAATLNIGKQPTAIEQADVYLIDGELSDTQIAELTHELLADPVTQTATIGSQPPAADAYIEVQPLPGVMDPDALVIREAIHAQLGVDVRVQTGERFDFHNVNQSTAREIAERILANQVIQAIHESPYQPAELPRGHDHEFTIVDVPIRELDDAALEKLSREAHLFLSLDEMKEIQKEYQSLGRDPRDIELETLAQTWSEHCVHKTLKSTIRYQESASCSVQSAADMSRKPGHTLNDDGSVTIDNLLKSTVAAATFELMEDGIDWCLSVFVDNAGIIAFDDDNAICFKCETHNHPSAIEPYGGAATGIGGCIRDIIGTGLAAKPIASTDIFCVAHPQVGEDERRPLPPGCLHPRRILKRVVAGVRDYGNRMGIPTVNGAVWFDNRYVGNPLVYCGCIGIMPRDRIEGDPQPGDRIIAIGGRTGRDGIHGATFSSAELTDTHADEFSHAVQIGNAMTEKQALDAILEARGDGTDRPCLFNAITDCGAGGFSSAIGEMGEKIGAYVQLENAPLKYDGLTPTEVWISEAQERMVLAVPAENIAALQNICHKHRAEMCDLGHFGTEQAELILTWKTEEIGRLPMTFLHDGLPKLTREATWTPPSPPKNSTSNTRDDNNLSGQDRPESPDIKTALIALLAHPNIASKHWIIEQYDHEVQGNTIIKPLVGPAGIGPSDAAVVQPLPGSLQAIAIANGLATGLAADPYIMTLCAIDECVRNLVCVGADPQRIAILDNFCWPSCSDPANLGSLVRAAEACYDGARAYRTPFVSGKDSLNNQFTTEDGKTIQIPPTLLISGVGMIDDVMKCITMDAKNPGRVLLAVGPAATTLHGSHFEMLYQTIDREGDLPNCDLQIGPRVALAMHSLILSGKIHAAHDVSDGGLLCAIAEMCIAGEMGCELDTSENDINEHIRWFGEGPSRYIIEVEASHVDHVKTHFGNDIEVTYLGTLTEATQLTINSNTAASIEELTSAWRGALDW